MKAEIFSNCLTDFSASLKKLNYNEYSVSYSNSFFFESIIFFSHVVSRKLNSGSTSSRNPIPSDITRYHLILTEPHLYTAYSVIEIICSHDFTTSYGHTRPMSLLDGGQLWTGDHNIHLFIGRANQSIIGLNKC